MKKLTNLAISCGGTGGHFYPGLGIAREFQAQGGKALLLVGGKNAPGQIQQAAACGVDAVPISMQRPSLKNPVSIMKAFFSFLRGIRETRQALRKFQPQAVLMMGSFASLPPAVASKMEHVPLYLHDGNARIGKANRFFSRLAKKLALSFPAVNADAVKCPTELTGFPLRRELMEKQRTKAEAVAEINSKFHSGLDPARPIVLIFGGSQGAAAINRNFDVAPEAKDLQVIHLAGKGKTEELGGKYASFPCKVLLLESCMEMDLMYQAADLVICRSGGSSVSELAYFGKYALLIPYPYAAELHQDDNAKWLASGGGAEIWQNSVCSPEKFRAFIADFLSNPEKYRTAGENSRKLASPDAASKVLKMIDENLSEAVH